MTKASRNETNTLRKAMQIVFEDPYASLDPDIAPQIVGEGAEDRRHWHGRGAEKARRRLLETVGLNTRCKALSARCSGGQRQRIGTACALALTPKRTGLTSP